MMAMKKYILRPQFFRGLGLGTWLPRPKTGPNYIINVFGLYNKS
jgi:hypothetical protein